MSKRDPLGKKQKRYDEKLLELHTSNFMLFEVVNSDEWKSFAVELDGTINLKHSTTYTRQMEDFSEEILLDVKNQWTSFVILQPQ